MPEHPIRTSNDARMSMNPLFATLSLVLLALLAVEQAEAAPTADDATLPAPRYSLKQDEASTGSHIKFAVVKQSVVPLNRRWHELTAAEQALVKSQYEGMSADDEPPFPVYGLAPIYRAISDAQQRLLVRGPLTLFVNVDEAGVAQSVSVVVAPNEVIAKAAAWALMRHPYKPARCDGRPCAMAYPFRMQMEVN